LVNTRRVAFGIRTFEREPVRNRAHLMFRIRVI